MATREQVFDALLSLIQLGVTGSATCRVRKYSRRMTLPAQVPEQDCPAIMLWEKPEDTQNNGFSVPPKRMWEVDVVLVVRNKDKEIPGATLINPIIEQLEAALVDPSSENQTLGGLVYSVVIDGRTIKETGDTDPLGLGGFIVPIKISVP